MFPKFLVTQDEMVEAGEVLGRASTTTYGDDLWVGDQRLGYLMADGAFIRGRWHQREDLWSFAPENSQSRPALSPNSEWTIFDLYWGERAELVLRSGRLWKYTQFHSMPAIRFASGGTVYMQKADGSKPGDGEVVEGGWDHEHCRICWEKIGIGGQSSGYVSDDDVWACARCYERFIEPRSLDFIPKI